MENYTFNTASLEIIIAMVAAFALGALLCYLLSLLGLLGRRKNIQETSLNTNTGSVGVEFSGDQPRVSVPPAPMVDLTAKTMPVVSAPVTTMPTPTHHSSRLSAEGGAYEADINSLLRGSGSGDSGSIPLPQTTSSGASFESRVRESLASSPVTSASTDYDALDMPDDDHVDDLKKLEGIGPRIEKLLNDAGIKSYVHLATMERDRLRDILQSGGREFTMHEPKSWPYQAELAAKQNWNRLREYQEFLLEGRKNN